MTRDALLAFMRRSLYAVEATVSPTREPQGAVVGIIVTDTVEVFFDTLRTSRKAQNLRRDPAIVPKSWNCRRRICAAYRAEAIRRSICGHASRITSPTTCRLRALTWSRSSWAVCQAG